MMRDKEKEKIIDTLRLYECFGIEYIEPLPLLQGGFKKLQKLPKDYLELREYVEHCNLCELSKSCDKKFGYNDPNSDIYIVGIDCNFDDLNTQNILYYFFNTVMGKDFNKLYMTNIIKCKTKNKIFDINGVISLCKDYFSQELAIGKPKYIFATLQACRYILKTEEIDKNCVGKSYKIGESVLFPVFDFSFLSKNPSYYTEMERVFKKIKGSIN